MTLLINAASPPPSESPARSARSTAVHAGVRAGVVTTGLLLGSWAGSAVAAPPEGWENAVNDSMLVSLLKLLGIPLAVIAIITLLTYLPLIMRGGRGAVDSTSWFAEHSEWFGGPRSTPEVAEGRVAVPEGQVARRGGASARW